MKLLPTSLLLAAATLAAASSVHAAALTWDNAGTATNNWNTTDFNWGGTTVWAQNDTATFTGTAGESITLTENITATGLTFSNTATSLYTLNIGSGLALNVNGNVTVGANAASSVTNATFAGLGSFIVGDGSVNRTFQVGGYTSTGTGGNTATLDMSGLSTFTANLGTGGTFRIGDVSTASSSTAAPSTVILANTSTITAGTLDIGQTTRHEGVQTLKLGATTNTLNANNIYVGSGGASATGGRGSGAISFNSEDGSLIIRNAAGTGRANLNLANTGQNTASNLTAEVNLTGHNANLLLDTLAIAVRTGNGTGGATGTFSFDTGTLDVTTVLLARKTIDGQTAGSAGGSNASTATLNIGGGTVNIGTGGIQMAVAGGSPRAATATVNITGGTVTVLGDITRNVGGSNGPSSATVNLSGGTLDMSGKNIGGANAVTFNAESGTLKNLAQLNNGGVLTKTTAGTLTLSGTNTYTGGTTISAGTLVAGSNTALGSGSVNVGTAGAILQIGSTGVTLGNGANLAVVDGATIKLGGLVAGALNGVGSVITLDGGTFNFNAAGQLDLGGVLNNLAAGDYTYRLISGAAGAGNTDFLFANITGYDASVSGLDYSNGVLAFTAVPEPSTYGLIGAGALAAAAFVRRRRKHAGAVAA